MLLNAFKFTITRQVWILGVWGRGGGGGYCRFQVMGMIKCGQKLKPPKIPRASKKTQKNPWTKQHPPKNPMPNFRDLKMSRKD